MGAMQPAVVQFGLDQPLQVALREVPMPEIGPADVLLAVGAASVCGSDVHQAYLTHSWPVNAPVTLGHEFGGVVAQLGTRREGLQGRRPRRQRDGRVHLRRVPAVPHRPLQPVPDAQGLRLRDRRRDGAVRARAGTLPAPHSRQPAVRHRLPDRAAQRRVPVDVRQRRHQARRPRRGARPRPDWPAVREDGGAERRVPAGGRRTRGRPRPARGGAGAGRHARGGRRQPVARGRRARRSIRSVPTSSAMRRGPAVRSTPRCRCASRTARSSRSAGRRTWCRSTSIRWSRRPSSCTARSATTIRCGSASSACWPRAARAPRRSSACAPDLEHWHEAFEGMHSGQVIKSVLLPHGPEGPKR